jgi:hypothetical protein
MAPDSSSTTPRGFRFQAGLPAALFAGDEELACRAHNLSRTGVLLVGALPAPSGQEIEFAIRAPVGGLEQRFIGRVARIEEGSEGGEIRLAVEFLALDLDQKEKLEMLLARVMEGMAPAPLEALRPGSPPHEIRKALESVPLAHRIGLAARAGPREREYLRQDTHPAVLESLARNPNILLAEVRTLLAVIHLPGSTLELIAADQRWSKDEELRILVATHPHVPYPLAERITAGLQGPALKKVLARPSLNAVLRDKIVRRIARG